MFQDSFFANVAVFLLGQVAAWGYMNTGLWWRGVLMLCGSWVLADVALVARFAYEHGDLFISALIAMQAVCVIGLFLFTYGRIRRRLPVVVAARERRFRTAFLLYLHDEIAAATRIYRKLVRTDPWDLPARVALGTVLARLGARRRSRWLLRTARGLDRDQRFEDVIADELRRGARPR